jgi:hypothetical protein
MQVQEAVGYVTAKDQPPEQAPFPQFGSLITAGGLYSCVTNLARFISLQFYDGVGAGRQILKGRTLREMLWLAP